MSALLLDASTILAAFDRDDANYESAKAILCDPTVTLTTLDLARYEVANVAVCAWGSLDRVTSLLDAVDQIGNDGGIVPAESKLMTRAAELAQAHSISVYDAAYVAAASSGARTLVSCDERDLVSNGLAVSPTNARKRLDDANQQPPTD